MRKEHSRNSSREEKEVLREALEQADLNRKEVVDLLLLLIRMSEDIYLMIPLLRIGSLT